MKLLSIILLAVSMMLFTCQDTIAASAKGAGKKVRKAESELKKGKVDKAIEEYEKAIKEYKEVLRKGKWQERADSQKGIVKALEGLGMTLEKQGQENQVIALLEQHSTYPLVKARIGHIYAEQKNLEKAYATYTEINNYTETLGAHVKNGFKLDICNG